MRVAGVQTFGAQVEHFELPDPRPPAPGTALLAVKAAGVGNWDDIVRTGGWDVGTRPPNGARSPSRRHDSAGRTRCDRVPARR
jgi:hypothetical protein